MRDRLRKLKRCCTKKRYSPCSSCTKKCYTWVGATLGLTSCRYTWVGTTLGLTSCRILPWYRRLKVALAVATRAARRTSRSGRAMSANRRKSPTPTPKSSACARDGMCFVLPWVLVVCLLDRTSVIQHLVLVAPGSCSMRSTPFRVVAPHLQSPILTWAKMMSPPIYPPETEVGNDDAPPYFLPYLRGQ